MANASTAELWPELDRIPKAPPPPAPSPDEDAAGYGPPAPLQGFMRLSGELGPIFRFEAPGFQMVIASGADLVAELVDESRFAKHVGFGMAAYREVTADGLFTAFNDEPNWQLAHDILAPAFTLEAMRSYHAAMVTTVRELIAAWDKRAGEPVDVVGDMTNVALESIGRAGFGYTFESFERTGPHPFIASMIATLQHSTKMPEEQLAEKEQHEKNVRFMHDLVDDVVRRRQESGDTRTNDLLGVMLNTSQDGTGRRLDLTNIRNQITTFLVAGFGTSAGLMSFALYYLTKHPDVLAKAREEVDRVLGGDLDADPTYEQVAKLRYVRKVLDESLRLWPPAAVFMREAREDTVLGGTYPMKKGAWALVLTPVLHRDPAVWGEDAERFDPERFTPEAIRSRPAHAYKPFGTGPRACIGRQFAQHEATLAVAMLLQRFDLRADPDYELTVGEPGFFMPAGFTLTARPRAAAAGDAAVAEEATEEAAVPQGCPHHSFQTT
ncbi:cytochrome P450 [Microbispora sp. NPDC049125]|uniref:cytochrome P450 n=1 Tax=Microbispora sp. NPDC049125 TaxID=3154929 RepID=UPI0034661ED4